MMMIIIIRNIIIFYYYLFIFDSIRTLIKYIRFSILNKYEKQKHKKNHSENVIIDVR